MLRAEEREKCGHPGCTCDRTEESNYCSPYCEGAGEEAELACECGHPLCSGVAP